MARLLQVIMIASYVLGLFSVVLAVAARMIPAVGQVLVAEPRSGLVFGGALFLCSLATRSVEQSMAK